SAVVTDNRHTRKLSMRHSPHARWTGFFAVLTAGALFNIQPMGAQAPVLLENSLQLSNSVRPLLTYKDLNEHWTNSPLSELKAAADAGDATAQCYLGERLMIGKDISKDRAQAAAWFRKAAERGLAYAQNRLGWAYEKGEGVPESRDLAVEWIRKAA